MTNKTYLPILLVTSVLSSYSLTTSSIANASDNFEVSLESRIAACVVAEGFISAYDESHIEHAQWWDMIAEQDKVKVIWAAAEELLFSFPQSQQDRLILKLNSYAIKCEASMNEINQS